jgi:integrase
VRGSIIKRGQRYSVVLDLGRDPVTGERIRKWHSGYLTKKDAERAQIELVHGLEHGTYVEPTKETLGSFLERWLRDYVATNVAPSAYKRYAGIVRTQIGPQLGQIPLAQLRPSHLVAAQRHWLQAGRLWPAAVRGTPLSARTVLHHHRVLHEALAQAVKWGDLGRNPMDAVDPPRVDRHEARTLDEAQARRWLEYVEGREYGLLLHTAFYTGMRLGELLGLRWQDIDLERGLLFVRQQYDRVAHSFRDTKSYRGRRGIALPSVLVARLRLARKGRLSALGAMPTLWQATDLVFSDATGSVLGDDRVRRLHYRYLAELGLPRVKPHELRHTHATHLLHQGADINLVASRLGHATPAFTLSVYGHLLPGADSAAVERFAARFEETRAGTAQAQ